MVAKLRPRNVHSANDRNDLLPPEVDRQHAAGKHGAFRSDPAFVKPETDEALEARQWLFHSHRRELDAAARIEPLLFRRAAA